MRISDWSSDVCSSDLRSPEGGEMRPSIPLRDVVGETQHIFIIGVVPFQGHVDPDVISLSHDSYGMGDQRRFITIKPFDECCDAAFIIKLDLFGVLMPRIRQKQAHAAVETSKFAKARFQLVEI